MSTESSGRWDIVTRAGHWLVAGLFLANQFFTDPEESWHHYFGYSIVAIVLLRLIWGLTFARGPNRLSCFIPSKTAITEHLRALRQREPYDTVGHNPFGAMAIYLMWAGLLLLALTGWIEYYAIANFIDFADLHEVLGEGLLLLVGVHVSAVIAMSLYQRVNLIRAMIFGRFR
ncbi:MAG: cytochrome b/b6 domain-containing protein [Gammaproteobacteria bacterium]|nr:cytochrome b/b6 domain-containing protein [Gammaproteobacteria bacterium]